MNTTFKISISRKNSSSNKVWIRITIIKIRQKTRENKEYAKIDYITFINLVFPIIKRVVPFSEIAEATDSSSSPEFPMHVVHPYPTI